MPDSGRSQPGERWLFRLYNCGGTICSAIGSRHVIGMMVGKRLRTRLYQRRSHLDVLFVYSNRAGPCSQCQPLECLLLDGGVTNALKGAATGGCEALAQSEKSQDSRAHLNKFRIKIEKKSGRIR